MIYWVQDGKNEKEALNREMPLYDGCSYMPFSNEAIVEKFPKKTVYQVLYEHAHDELLAMSREIGQLNGQIFVLNSRIAGLVREIEMHQQTIRRLCGEQIQHNEETAAEVIADLNGGAA